MLWKRALCCIVTQRKYHLLRSATLGCGGGDVIFAASLGPSAPFPSRVATRLRFEVHATNVALSALGPRGPRSAQMVQLYQRSDKCPHTWLTLTRTNIEVAKVNT